MGEVLAALSDDWNAVFNTPFRHSKTTIKSSSRVSEAFCLDASGTYYAHLRQTHININNKSYKKVKFEDC